MPNTPQNPCEERAKAKAERASRKRLRTQWRTGATEEDKNRAVRLALNTQLPRARKYDWLKQEPDSVAETIGVQRALELEINEGPIAEQLGIGEHKKPPTTLKFSVGDYRAMGLCMTPEQLKELFKEDDNDNDNDNEDVTEKPAEVIPESPKPVLPTPRRAPKAWVPLPPVSSRVYKRKQSADSSNTDVTKKRSRQAKRTKTTEQASSKKTAAPQDSPPCLSLSPSPFGASSSSPRISTPELSPSYTGTSSPSLTFPPSPSPAPISAVSPPASIRGPQYYITSSSPPIALSHTHAAPAANANLATAFVEAFPGQSPVFALPASAVDQSPRPTSRRRSQARAIATSSPVPFSPPIRPAPAPMTSLSPLRGSMNLAEEFAMAFPDQAPQASTPLVRMPPQQQQHRRVDMAGYNAPRHPAPVSSPPPGPRPRQRRLSIYGQDLAAEFAKAFPK